MACKISIAQLLVVLFHFIERITGGRSGSIEHPGAFGTAPALEIGFSIDPFQFAAHGLPNTTLIWCGHALVKDGVSLFSSATAMTKASLFALDELLQQVTALEHTPSPN